MQFRSLISVILLFLGAFLVLFFTGCSDSPTESYLDKLPLAYDEELVSAADWPDEKLLEQFAGYWYHRFAGGVDQTWLSEAPHFRLMATEDFYEQYILGGAGQVLSSVEIQKIDKVTDNFYRVLMRLVFKRAGRDVQLTMRDHWVFLEGQWYHVIRDPLAFPFSASIAEMQ